MIVVAEPGADELAALVKINEQALVEWCASSARSSALWIEERQGTAPVRRRARQPHRTTEQRALLDRMKAAFAFARTEQTSLLGSA